MGFSHNRNKIQVKHLFIHSRYVFLRIKRPSSLVLSVLLLSILFAACSMFGSSSNVTPPLPIGSGTSGAATQTQVSLTSLHWCGKSLVLFQDDGASKVSTPTATATLPAATPQTTPRTVTDWSQIEPNLGFTVYLPQALPAGTCLTSVYGTFHDPVLGGSFTIGYLLPDHSALSFSETPLVLRNTQFQCSPASSTGVQEKTGATPTPGAIVIPLQECTGSQGSTGITLLAHGNTATLQKFFDALQPHVNWQPTS